jgi:phosphate:Na+ symporter
VKITDIFTLLGGLALFLYGMHIMGEGLELVAGTKLQRILEKLTTNRFLGVLVGLFTTVIIQSSSATTVMVVGFVNAGLMNLTQAVGVIMGANIGTTITAQLIALDFTSIAPIIAFIGMLLVMFVSKKRVNYVGQVIIGLGILFIGMNTMSAAMKPLRTVPEFADLMTRFDNPFLAILVGLLVTSIIQSSSASIGILQALAGQGLIGISGAMYVVLGQNIGTCVTALLASISGNKNAKRAALTHVLFNVIGTVIFIIISFILPFASWLEALTPGDSVQQIANFHSIFNIATTILLFPFGAKLANIALKLIKGEDQLDKQIKLEYLSNVNFLDSSIAIANIESELGRMKNIVNNNLDLVMSDFTRPSEELIETVTYQEELIDFLNKEIAKGIIKTTALPLSKEAADAVNKHLVVISNLERIGDHAMNIIEHAQNCLERNLTFSKEGFEELNVIRETIQKMFTLANDRSLTTADRQNKVYVLEEQVDDLTKQSRENHMKRMSNGECDIESGIIFDEMLTDLERVADHLMNISEIV